MAKDKTYWMNRPRITLEMKKHHRREIIKEANLKFDGYLANGSRQTRVMSSRFINKPRVKKNKRTKIRQSSVTNFI